MKTYTLVCAMITRHLRVRFMALAVTATMVFVPSARMAGAQEVDTLKHPALVLWLDAQEICGPDAKLAPPRLGQHIRHWADRSGHDHHAVQSDPQHCPTLQDQPGAAWRFVHFEAANSEYLSVSNEPSLAVEQLSVFVVARARSCGTNMWLFGKNNFHGRWSGFGIAVEGNSLAPWPHLGLGGQSHQENGYLQFSRGLGGEFSIVELVQRPDRVVGLFNGRIEKAQIARGQIQANENDLLIGASPQNAPACEFLQGDIAELLIFNLPLSHEQRRDVRQYLAAKYAISIETDASSTVVIDNGYLPIIVDNPTTPATRTRSADEAAAILRRDWLFQAAGASLFERTLAEITWARQLALRLSRCCPTPDLNGELAELEQLEQQITAAAATASDDTIAEETYVAIRRIKRRITFKNPHLDFSQVLFIDQPYPQGPEWQHEAVHRMGHRAVPGGRLLVLEGLHPDGQIRQLAPDRPGSFWRPDVSFDGDRVLFCYKAHDEPSFHLYEVAPNGSGLRQLTDSPYDDIDPIYLPDGHIAFTTTRGNTYVRCGPYIYSYILARCDADGGNVYLISTNSEPDFLPSLLNDGRVVYSRWEYSDKDQNRVQSLWTTNQNGTGTSVLWGNQSVWPDHLAEPRPFPASQRIMFTAVAHHDWFHGTIGIIDPHVGSDFPDGLSRVTWDLPWPEVGATARDVAESGDYHAAGNYTGYLGAYPISDDDFLVSARGPDDKFRLYLMDVHGNRELIYEGVYNIWYAIPVRPRPRPPQQPDEVIWPGTGVARQTVQPGFFYNPDVYQGVPEIPRGSVKYLRVFQQDAKTYSTWNKVFVFSGPPVSAVQTEAVKRIVSTAVVEPDGSVYFEAPAGQSLYFQLLDEHCRALHTMRSFTGVLPGERRGCVGCHKMHSTAPLSRTGMAFNRVPTPQTLPPWGHESIGYQRFVQPLLDRYCVRCHGGDNSSPPDLRVRTGPGEFREHVFQEPYLTLVGPAAWPVPVPTAGQPGYGLAGAFPVYGLSGDEVYSQDPLTDSASTILRTLRPMTYLSYRSRLVELAINGTHYETTVDRDSLLRLIAWVDANCPYLGEEEIREMDDPDFPGIDQLPIRPRVRSAPVIVRP